jgi:hypothetical protein
MTKAIRVSYGSYGAYSGPFIKGFGDAMEIPTLADPHWRRVLWLTIMVESGGKLGSVVMFDGTACTTGIEQSILVYPRNLKQQGPLPGLLYLLDHVVPISYYDLGTLLADQKWVIAGDKQIRDADKGTIISPKVLRDTLTPVGGKVPRFGPAWEQSCRWALAFHEVFSLEETREAQIKHAMDGFTKFARRECSPQLDKDNTIENLVYGGDVMVPRFQVDTIDGAINDMAMALFWERKTNGPVPALKRLKAALNRYDAQDPAFGRFLIRQLSTASWGRWATNRNKRARKFAQQVWPKALFNGPKAVWPAKF